MLFSVRTIYRGGFIFSCLNLGLLTETQPLILLSFCIELNRKCETCLYTCFGKHVVWPFPSGLQAHTLRDSSGPGNPEDLLHPYLQKMKNRSGGGGCIRKKILNKSRIFRTYCHLHQSDGGRLCGMMLLHNRHNVAGTRCLAQLEGNNIVC